MLKSFAVCKWKKKKKHFKIKQKSMLCTSNVLLFSSLKQSIIFIYDNKNDINVKKKIKLNCFV
jgi:hypothetical protein